MVVAAPNQPKELDGHAGDKHEVAKSGPALADSSESKEDKSHGAVPEPMPVEAHHSEAQAHVKALDGHKQSHVVKAEHGTGH